VNVDSDNESDLGYACSGKEHTLAPVNSNRFAVVTSAPDSAACVNATNRQPITQLIFADLKEGMHICLVTDDPHQINSLTLVKKKSSYALTFSVTAWTPPHSS
jgi:hypothetical protein